MRIAIAICLWTLAATALAEPSGIAVTGIGRVATVPDMATITISVTERDRDANAAQDRVNRTTAAALEVIDGLGIAERDVTATVMNLHPIYRQPRQQNDVVTIEAFQASRTITIRVRNLDKLGDVVNGALDKGINGINQIELDTSERTTLEREALELAIDEAKDEAARVAERFGVSLGALVRVDVGQAPQPVFARAAMAFERADMPFRPGEMTIERHVTATFAIDQP